MQILKPSELFLLNEKGILPTISLPQYFMKVKQQKFALDCSKQSDFIRRLKNSKSIMLAQKNRKQKNVLNPYKMENLKRKENQYQSLNKNSFHSIVSPSKRDELMQNSSAALLQRILFPPVHSSPHTSLVSYNKHKAKSMRSQKSVSINQVLDVEIFMKQKQEKRRAKVSTPLIQQNQVEKWKIIKKSQTERQIIKQKDENLNQSEKRLHRVKSHFQHKIQNRKFKLYRHQTEQVNCKKIDKLDGWEFQNNEQDQQSIYT